MKGRTLSLTILFFYFEGLITLPGAKTEQRINRSLYYYNLSEFAFVDNTIHLKKVPSGMKFNVIKSYIGIKPDCFIDNVGTDNYLVLKDTSGQESVINYDSLVWWDSDTQSIQSRNLSLYENGRIIGKVRNIDRKLIPEYN